MGVCFPSKKAWQSWYRQYHQKKRCSSRQIVMAVPKKKKQSVWAAVIRSKYELGKDGWNSRNLLHSTHWTLGKEFPKFHPLFNLSFSIPSEMVLQSDFGLVTGLLVLQYSFLFYLQPPSEKIECHLGFLFVFRREPPAEQKH